MTTENRIGSDPVSVDTVKEEFIQDGEWESHDSEREIKLESAQENHASQLSADSETTEELENNTITRSTRLRNRKRLRRSPQPSDATGSLQREKSFVCDECGHRSYKNSHLIQHIRTHTGEKPYACTKCDYRTTQRGTLLRHMVIHSDDKPFACLMCDYRASRKRYLTLHTYSHLSKKPFACPECDFKSTRKDHLKTHVKTHSGEKPIASTECDFSATQKGNPTLHLRTYSRVKPYACAVCDFRAARKEALIYHVRTHTAEKSFVCTECDYKATTENGLDKHIQTHIVKMQREEIQFGNAWENYDSEPEILTDLAPTIERDPLALGSDCETTEDHDDKTSIRLSPLTNGKTLDHSVQSSDAARVFVKREKPFACTECDFRATQKGSLVRHVMKHSGAKPFACALCDYCASQKVDFIHHMRTHTGEKPFGCAKCDFRTSLKPSLRRHMKIHVQ